MTVDHREGRRPSLVRCLGAGLFAGLVAAVVVVPAAGLLQHLVGRTYPGELAPTHLAQATVLATLLAGITFYGVQRWTGTGRGLFALLVLGFAIVYSVVVLLAPPAPGFGLIVAPLHLLVAGATLGVFALADSHLWAASAAPSWRGYGAIAAVLLSLLLVAFLVVEALDVPLLTDATPSLGKAGIGAATVGVGLLVIDVFVPVPSSGVMVAQGALFGIVGGTLLSLAGGLGATLLGFLIGRRSRRLVERTVPPHEQDRANALLERYGILAIIVTRPVPMLAETTAIIAGTSTLGWRTAALAGMLGNLVPALLYAITGAVAASFGNHILVFITVIAVAVVFWLVMRLFPGRIRDTTG